MLLHDTIITQNENNILFDAVAGNAFILLFIFGGQRM